MSTPTTKYTLTNSPALKKQWQTIHAKDRNEELSSQTTRELLKYARKLGLRKSHIEKYGSTSSKKCIMAAIRDIFLLNKLVNVRSESGDSEATRGGSYSSDDDFDEDDVVTLHTLQREKALKKDKKKLKKEKADFKKEKAKLQAGFEKEKKKLRIEFEKEKLMLKMSFENKNRILKEKIGRIEHTHRSHLKCHKALQDKFRPNMIARASLEKEVKKLKQQVAQVEKDQGVSVKQRADFYREKKEHERARQDLEMRKKTLEKDRSQFEAQKLAQSSKLKKMQTEINFFRSQSLKRKREADSVQATAKRAMTEKHRAISDIERVLRQLKGEKYWSYGCPSQLRGTDAALWSKYKCKRLINGKEYSSDVLRGPKGQVPKWQNLTEVVNVLCSQVV
jgi:hypothetical protein